MMKKKDITLGVRVDAELEGLIRSLAEQEDRSVSWIVRELIIEGLRSRNHVGSSSD